MKQKLALACTLVHEPHVLLLDEPTTGVDPVSRREFWKLLSEFLADGLTIVMATPYLDEAERCARVALLHEGRLLALDARRALQAGLDGRLLEVVADARASAARGPGARSRASRTCRRSATARTSAWPTATPGAAASRRRRRARAARHSRADRAAPIAATLEDVFIDLITADATRGAVATPMRHS